MVAAVLCRAVVDALIPGTPVSVEAPGDFIWNDGVPSILTAIPESSA